MRHPSIASPSDEPTAAHSASESLPDPRAVPILARSLYRQMRAQGFGHEHILALSGALLELVHGEMCHESTTRLTLPAE